MSTKESITESRRGFLRNSLFALGATAAAPAALSASSHNANRSSVFGEYPTFKIGTMSQLKKEKQIDFPYPDSNSQCKAVYVNGEAKAYHTVCTHKGCPTVYDEESGVFECPCHYTKYDAKKDGQMIIGHATGGLPQVRLLQKGDDIYAIGIDRLIFGRINNNRG
ncbi:MAG: arsenate reductase (azurin) small subunit [Campylobacterota bacterium]